MRPWTFPLTEYSGRDRLAKPSEVLLADGPIPRKWGGTSDRVILGCQDRFPSWVGYHIWDDLESP